MTALFFGGGVFVGTVLLIELGRRIGLRQIRRHPDAVRSGLGPVDSAVYAMLGLMIAFTFSAAFLRFDARRNFIVEESNAIGTAYLRVALLPADVQPRVRDLFRRYVDSRLATYEKIDDLDAAMTEYRRSIQIQQEIWKEAVDATQDLPSTAPAMLLLPALNEMIDITNTRLMATRIHQPWVVFAMLGVLSLASALLAGYGMASGPRSPLHNVLFAAVVAATIYIIIDLEYPRFGIIRIDAVDRALAELRQSMN
jgi:hypothetical protein